MPLKIVRNDITKMKTDIIVNTANDHPTVGTGCDYAIYEAAGREELLAYRKEQIGYVPEGDAFLTPAFNLPVKYIVHAVSPYYEDGLHGEEEKLRSCYRKSLQLIYENGGKSAAFPLISTGGFGYPIEEGLRIAVDEINSFLLIHDVLIYLVLFGQKASKLGSRIYPDLEEYIDQNYVEEKHQEEYFGVTPVNYTENRCANSSTAKAVQEEQNSRLKKRRRGIFSDLLSQKKASTPKQKIEDTPSNQPYFPEELICDSSLEEEDSFWDFESVHESKLEERMKHISDTFSEYLLYLIQIKNMENAEVYKRAIVDKKIFSKIKNNVNYHPQKRTALCLCIGAKLNLDESKDLLARAGYALSPCDKMDIIFSYFIENGIYDMIELDIQLEEHGLPCIIS